MTTPNIKFPLWAAAQAEPWLTENETKNLIDALMPGVAISDALATPPASPAAGACYIVAASATGAWAGWEKSIAVYIGGAWVRVIPQEGWVFWVVSNSGRSAYIGGVWVKLIEEAPSDGTAYARKDGGWLAVGQSGGMYDMEVKHNGSPSPNQVIFSRLLGRNVDFAADFSGSVGKIGTKPSTNILLDVRADGSNIGTITISSAGIFTFSTVGGIAKNISAGALIEVVAPASAAGASDISVTLVGSSDGGVLAPISSNRWRILVTGNTHWNGVTTLAEVEMMDAVGGADICIGGVATESSAWHPTQVGAAAFDNSVDTRWGCAAGDVNSGIGAWVEYQFPAPVLIKQISLTAPSANMTQLPADFELQYYDGVQWITQLARAGEPVWTPLEKRYYTV